MARRHKAEEIVAKLRQVDVLTSQGKAAAEAIRSIGIPAETSEAFPQLNRAFACSLHWPTP